LQTEALEKLSIEHRYVVSTGGGAVIQDENWYNSGHNILNLKSLPSVNLFVSFMRVDLECQHYSLFCSSGRT